MPKKCVCVMFAFRPSDTLCLNAPLTYSNKREREKMIEICGSLKIESFNSPFLTEPYNHANAQQVSEGRVCFGLWFLALFMFIDFIWGVKRSNKIAISVAVQDYQSLIVCVVHN